ncbi:hypothetical protein DPMN_033175 [Dreissena polymorpha]|uniref:Uncharacterized protein n=1 Tax=Dreissena polymorpha TaxID=45954 RepID=A0A9D4M6I4_DREPO|nr:hypothetical protein DPMN_033175 [Dreissena polymorpha]
MDFWTISADDVSNPHSVMADVSVDAWALLLGASVSPGYDTRHEPMTITFARQGSTTVAL